MKIINLTPHPITIGSTTIPPDGRIPRVAELVTPAGEVAGLPITEVRLGDVTGLPEQESGTWLVVSRMVAQTAPGRSDLLFPGEQVRDDAGRIVGCRSLGRLPAPRRPVPLTRKTAHLIWMVGCSRARRREEGEMVSLHGDEVARLVSAGLLARREHGELTTTEVGSQIADILRGYDPLWMNPATADATLAEIAVMFPGLLAVAEGVAA